MFAGLTIGGAAAASFGATSNANPMRIKGLAPQTPLSKKGKGNEVLSHLNQMSNHCSMYLHKKLKHYNPEVFPW